MEVQSKQGPMVGWAVQKDGVTSKVMFMQSYWEVILDTEINLNPLMYIDHDIQFSGITQNVLINGQPITIPEEHFGNDDEVITK